MTRKIMLACVLFALVSGFPALALELEPIPAGANIVAFVNNHAGLPLGDLLTSAPIPDMAKQKLNEFMTATSFNPLKDIAKIQAMVKKGATKREDNAVIVLSGSFNKDKIMGFIKEKIGKEISKEKLGEYSVFKSPDGKGGLCFVDSGRVAFGTFAALSVYLEARGGKEISKDFDELLKNFDDKAYAGLMVGGAEYLKGEMTKRNERRQARMEKLGRGPNPVAAWLENYLSEGVEPQGVFAQVQNNRVEGKIFYNRADSKGLFVHAAVELNDPKLTIEKMFGEFVKALGTLPTPEPGEKAPPKNPNTRW